MSNDKEKLESLIEDLEAIKSAIHKHDPIIRELAKSDFFAGLSLAFGIVATVFSFAFHFLTRGGGSLETVPYALKALLVGLIAVSVLGGGILKYLVIQGKAKSMEPSLDFWMVIRKVYSGAFFHILTPVSVSMIAASIFLAANGHPWYALPLVSVGAGIIVNAFANLIGYGEFYFTGYWGMTSGLVSLPFVESSPFLWLGIVCGGLFFTFSLSSFVANRKRKNT